MPNVRKSKQETIYALSLKQPWAALLVHGHKTIEVRRWPTHFRGRVLIHAARVSDDRKEVWAMVPKELHAAAKVTGGIIGAIDVLDCIAYRDRESFSADRHRHLNDPSWFGGPVLYGFRMANPQTLPFRPYKGWVRFFPVESEPPGR